MSEDKMSDPWADIRELAEPTKEIGIVAHDRIVMTGEDLRNLLTDADALLEAVPRPRYGYTTNTPRPHEVTLHFDSHEEMLEWLEALAALPENLRGGEDE